MECDTVIERQKKKASEQGINHPNDLNLLLSTAWDDNAFTIVSLDHDIRLLQHQGPSKTYIEKYENGLDQPEGTLAENKWIRVTKEERGTIYFKYRITDQQFRQIRIQGTIRYHGRPKVQCMVAKKKDL